MEPVSWWEVGYDRVSVFRELSMGPASQSAALRQFPLWSELILRLDGVDLGLMGAQFITVSVCSVVSWFFVTPWTAACQAPLFMGLSRQEYWSGLPFPPPGDVPDPGFELTSLAWQADSLPLNSQGSLHLSPTWAMILGQGWGMKADSFLICLLHYSLWWCLCQEPKKKHVTWSFNLLSWIHLNDLYKAFLYKKMNQLIKPFIPPMALNIDYPQKHLTVLSLVSR